MEAEIINPFIKATVDVIKTMAFLSPVAGKPYVKLESAAIGDVSSVIGLTGDANGTIAISFDKECILMIVSNMFGEKIEEMNDEVTDAVGELANMISGQARQRLEKQKRHFNSAIPNVILGKGHEITHITDGPKIAIPFSLGETQFTFEVCFKED